MERVNITKIPQKSFFFISYCRKKWKTVLWSVNQAGNLGYNHSYPNSFWKKHFAYLALACRWKPFTCWLIRGKIVTLALVELKFWLHLKRYNCAPKSGVKYNSMTKKCHFLRVFFCSHSFNIRVLEIQQIQIYR